MYLDKKDGVMMPKNLVIVESPSKSKTIEKYLGKDYKVVSSKGHIRDLATSGKFGLGVDIEDNFKPNYKIIRGKKKDVDALRKNNIPSIYSVVPGLTGYAQIHFSNKTSIEESIASSSFEKLEVSFLVNICK